MTSEQSQPPAEPNYSHDDLRRMVALVEARRSESELLSLEDLSARAAELDISTSELAEALREIQVQRTSIGETATDRRTPHLVVTSALAALSGAGFCAAAFGSSALPETIRIIGIVGGFTVVAGAEATFAFYVKGSWRYVRYHVTNVALWAGWGIVASFVNPGDGADVGTVAFALGAIVGTAIIRLRDRLRLLPQRTSVSIVALPSESAVGDRKVLRVCAQLAPSRANKHPTQASNVKPRFAF